MAHDPFGQSEHGGSGIRLDDVGFSPHLGNVIVHTGPYALLGAVRADAYPFLALQCDLTSRQWT